MNIFVVARSRDNKDEFFAYVISQKRRVTLRKKLQNSVAEVKRSPHTKIQLFLSTLKMAKKSRGRSCPQPFNYSVGDNFTLQVYRYDVKLTVKLTVNQSPNLQL